MTIPQLDWELQKYWMTLTVEERFRTCCQLYEAEKAILERLAPGNFMGREVQEFIFYHMHGFEMPAGVLCSGTVDNRGA